RDGRTNDTGFGSRGHGTGPYARLLARRFDLAAKRNGLDTAHPSLDTTRLDPPPVDKDQLALF
ncbi:MAG: PA0069 family radical SAM protein, partial [Alphaproteobacteria bacterium]